VARIFRTLSLQSTSTTRVLNAVVGHGPKKNRSVIAGTLLCASCTKGDSGGNVFLVLYFLKKGERGQGWPSETP